MSCLLIYSHSESSQNRSNFYLFRVSFFTLHYIGSWESFPNTVFFKCIIWVGHLELTLDRFLTLYLEFPDTLQKLGRSFSRFVFIYGHSRLKFILLLQLKYISKNNWDNDLVNPLNVPDLKTKSFSFLENFECCFQKSIKWTIEVVQLLSYVDKMIIYCHLAWPGNFIVNVWVGLNKTKLWKIWQFQQNFFTVFKGVKKGWITCEMQQFLG